MRYFATLFDKKYLAQGIALYQSLRRHSSVPFNLDVLCLDEETLLTLGRFALHGDLTLWNGTEGRMFDSIMGMSKCRRDRTWREFCWTCASNFAAFLLCPPPDDDGFIAGGLRDEITYLDADTFFFSDPEVAFSEIGAGSIAITPHRLIPSKKHLETNGLYNVGFVHFKNTPVGQECLLKWAAQCRERCSEKVGCGDQLYLDSWPIDYGSACCVIQNIGVNAGPWSLANWKVTEGPRIDGVEIISYHCHELDLNVGRLTNYELRPEDRELIYAPYLEAYGRAKELIARVGALASQ